VWNLTGLHAF